MSSTAWPLTGRDEELRLLHELVGPRGSSVVIGGAAGVGKSRLAAGFIDELAARGVRTVVVRVTQSTASVPFGAFARWVPEQDDAAPDRLVVLQTVASALRAGADVVCIDDAHLLDDGSAALVLHLAEGHSVRLVVTVRSGAPCPDGVTALWKEDLAERVDVQPLAEAQAAALLDRVLGGPVAPDTERRLWRLTEGSPLYLREVVRAGIDHGTLRVRAGLWHWRGDLPVSDELTALVGDRIAAAGPLLGEAIQLVALGEPLPIALLASITTPEPLIEAEEKGLIAVDDTPSGRFVRLAHPLYGEVVRARLPALVAQEHLRALAAEAAAVGWHDVQPLRVACWWLASGDPNGDVGVYLVAASRAAAVRDFELAARLATAAAAAHSSAEPRAHLIHAAALIPLQRYDDAEAVLARLSSHDVDDDVLAHAARINADLLFWGRGDARGASEVLVRAAERLSDPARAWVLIHDARLAQFAADPERATTLAIEAMASAGPVEAARVHAVATAMGAWVLQGRTSAALGAGELGLPFVLEWFEDDPYPAASIAYDYSLALVLDGRLDAAATFAEDVLERTRQAHVDFHRAVPECFVAHVALLQGRLATAQRHARDALSIFGEHNAFGNGDWSSAILAAAAAQTGDIATATETLEWATANRCPAARLFGPLLAMARAWLSAAQGELSTGRRHAQAAADEAADCGMWSLELLALLDVVRLGGASSVTVRLGQLAGIVEGAYATTVAEYALAVAGHDGEALDALSDRFRDMGARLLACEAAAEAASSHRAAGRAGSRLASSARARRLAAECEGPVTPAVRDLDADPLRATLTDREREVVELAAHGLTNREIAERLFLSVRTVHSHLQRAYAKLGVNDRTQLALIIEPQESAPPC